MKASHVAARGRLQFTVKPNHSLQVITRINQATFSNIVSLSICKLTLKFTCTVHTAIDICCLLTLFLSGNGTFVGVGTAEGDISVYIAWSLAVSDAIK